MPLCHFSVPARPGHAGAGRCRVCRLRSGRRPPFLHSCILAFLRSCVPAFLHSCVVHAVQRNRCRLLHRLPPRNGTCRIPLRRTAWGGTFSGNTFTGCGSFPYAAHGAERHSDRARRLPRLSARVLLLFCHKVTMFAFLHMIAGRPPHRAPVGRRRRRSSPDEKIAADNFAQNTIFPRVYYITPCAGRKVL